MTKVITLILVTLFFSNHVAATQSLISIESKFSVKETADRFESIVVKKGLTLFARINHHKNAASVNLTLRETEVILFGNPKVGTPLMQCAQEVAIDLPQKVMVWKDDQDKVWVSYNNPYYLKARHAMKGCSKTIYKISNVLKALSNLAASD